MPKPPKLWICEGKSCRKKKTERAAIVHAVGDGVRVRPVGCQKICDGPVVGLEVDGTLEWFESVDSEKAVAALRTLTTTGVLEKPLAKRRVGKRAGKMRC